MQQKVLFSLGMDSDHSPESAEMQVPGVARKRVNCRVLSSDNDQVGSIETVRGNTEVTYSLPAGDNIVIGCEEYLMTQKIYYFVYNSAKAHRILEYDYALGVVSLVLEEAAAAPYYLNFNPDRPITGITIVEIDANNHLMGWTDDYVNPNDENDYNEPKKLNIEKAKAFSAGDFVNGYPSPFELRFITRIKQPPLSAPNYVWMTDSAQLINHLDKTFWTFKTQFVYDDGELSTWSPISKIAFPETVNEGGSGEDLTYTSNKIRITVPTGSGIVTRIRIAAQKHGFNGYSLIADLSKENLSLASDTTYDYDFFNDGNYVQLADADSNLLYSNVPQRAKAETFAENRIFWGKVTENFDPTYPDIRMPLTYEVLSTPTNSFFVNHSYLKGGGAYKHCIVYYDYTGNRSSLSNIVSGKSTEYVGDRFGTTLYVPFLTDPLYVAPHATPNTDMQYIPVVNMKIYHEPPSWAYKYQILRSHNESMGRYLQFVAEGVSYLDINKNPTAVVADMVYLLIDTSNITQRYLFENPNSQLVYSFIQGDRIRFIANNDVVGPVGGPWVPTSSTAITSFFAFNDTEVISYDSTSQVAVIKMNSTTPTNLIPGCLYEIYQPLENVINDQELVYEIAEEGLIVEDANGTLSHEGSSANQLTGTVVGALWASPVLTVGLVTGHGITVGDNVKVTTDDYSVYGVVTATGVTSADVDTTGFTMIGTFNPVASGVIVKAAELVLSSGDCFRRYCDMPYEVGGTVYRLYSFIETSSASNLFTSDITDYGRPNAIDPEIKRVTRESGISWTEQFIQGTEINGLSTVLIDTNYEDFDNRYGSIQKLFTENMGMTVFQELKCGLIPVDRLMYSDAAGGNTVGISNNTINPQVGYYDGEFGIGKNPESFAVYGHAKYFIDLRRGAVLRLSTDGLTPISDIGNMHNYFSDKCQEYLNSNQNPIILGVYDQKFKEYIISFPLMTLAEPNPPIQPETLAWNEKANQWSTFYTYYPEMIGACNQGIVSFSAGVLYKHNDNAKYNNFYGVQYKSEFWVYLNALPSNVKVFKAISEESNAAWEVYEISTPNGQMSSLLVSDFEEKENNQYAGVLKDANTPNIQPPYLPIMDGDEMRDRTFLVKFRYPDADYNKINAVNFYFIESPLSNRN